MRFGYRKQWAPIALERGEFQPQGERLESRELFAANINFGGASALPQIASVPYGVIQAGSAHTGAGTASVPNGGAGYSVADVGSFDGGEAYLVGSPGPSSLLGIPATSYTQPEAYLVINNGWTTLPNTVQRVGNLEQLGMATQTSPIGAAGLNPPYLGLKFYSSAGSGSGLGFAVSPVTLTGSNSPVGFLISAPYSNTVYFVNASGLPVPAAGTTIAPIDLNAPPAGVSVVTLQDVSGGGGSLGESLASVGTVLNAGGPDIAIGDPTASVNGAQVNTGAVFVVPIADLLTASTTTPIDLSTIGTTGSQLANSVVFAGNKSGDQFGFSVAGAGNVTGNGFDDLLVGAPQVTNLGPGVAYLVHGGQAFSSLAITDSTPPNGTTPTTVYLPAGAIGGPNDSILPYTGLILGASFTGQSALDETGWSVSTAGEINDNGLDAIQIGSPGVTPNNTSSTGNTGSGYGVDTVVYPNTNFPITGQFLMPNDNNYLPTASLSPSTATNPTLPLDPTTSAVVLTANFVGQGPGDLAGYSVGIASRQIGTDITNELLIGAPGNNNDSGSVYIIPGTPTAGYTYLVGNFSLSDATDTSGPMNGTLISLSQGTSFNTSSPANFGASVSAGANTTDGDFIIGATGYSAVSTSPSQDGGAFVGDNTLLTAVTYRAPAQGNVVQTTASITTPPTATNNTVTIRVASLASTITAFNFVAATDILTTLPIFLNGYEILPSQYTVASAGAGQNNDALITITFTSAAQQTQVLGTNPSTATSVSLGGFLSAMLTSASSPQFWLGTNFAVSPSTPGSSTGALGSVLPAFTAPVNYTTPFGPDQFVPTVAQLSATDYKAIPLSVALAEYLPDRGFTTRIRNYYGLSHTTRRVASTHAYSSNQNSSLGSSVFDRSKFHAGKTVKFTHKVKVVPSDRQTEVYYGT